MSRKDDKRFDELLKKSFRAQFESELEEMPSEKELGELYPLTEEQMAKAYSLSKENKASKIKWTVYVQRAAVIAICVCCLSFGLILSNPAVQGTRDNEVVKKLNNDVNSIDFSHSENQGMIDIANTAVGYIPEGFELDLENISEGCISRVYKRGEDIIIVDIGKSEEIWIKTDTTSHELMKTQIHGYEAYISYDEEMIHGSVYFGNRDFTVAISGFAEKQELIKIAENIEIKD